MANSKYEYVKKFEKQDNLLPSTFIVIRIDGRGFHRFSNVHGFEKPNDRRALNLMNAAAIAVLKDISDISLAYGVSDEFSFVFKKSCTMFDRRESKLITTIVSTFTAYYIHLWPEHFPDTGISSLLPSFDGRAIIFPNSSVLKDYLSWRQVTLTISIIQSTGLLSRKAGTVAADKNEILFSKFKINYNNEDELFRKGSIIYRNVRGNTSSNDPAALDSENAYFLRTQAEKVLDDKMKAPIAVEHIDFIRSEFWNKRPWLLPKDLD